MLLCRAVCRCSGVDGEPEFFEHARGVGAECRFPNCLAGAILYLNIEMLAGIRRRFEPA